MLGTQEIPLNPHFGDTNASLWGGGIPKSTWTEFENVQKHFLTKFLQVKKQMAYTLLLLEIGSLPIEIMAMERVVEYMFKVQKSSSHQQLLELHGKKAKRSKRHIKAKFCIVHVECKI